MSSGGCDQPKPYLSGQNKGKRVMKRKRPRYVLKVNIPPPPNAPITHEPSPSPTPAHTSSPTPGLTPISTAASFPCPRTADIPFQSRRDISPTTSSPTPVVASAPSPSGTGPSTSSVPSPLSRVTPLSTPSPLSVPSRINDCAIGEGAQIYRDRGDAESNNEDDTLSVGHALPMISPYGNGVASQAITFIIKQQYCQPWLTWGSMTDEDREIFFKRFKKKVCWKPEHEERIKKNFHSKAAHRLSEMFMEARKNGKKPIWMFDDVWTSLLSQWNSPDFRSKCSQNQKNRTSDTGGSLHTGGSISTHEHAIRMAKQLGRPVYIDEVFMQTHIQKSSGEFVDERSRRTHEEFQSRLSQVRSEVASGSSPIDSAEEDRIRLESWLLAAGGKKKGRIYGVGDLAHNFKRGNTLTYNQPSSSSEDSPSVLLLKEEVRNYKEHNDKLTEHVKSLVSIILPFLPSEARSSVAQQS
ncbi:uncharacterized protein [Phaseolus vulgaris]|uniref:uncharacterized protein n=1 Tax=Phaseolus vulgaris TaxID=3885 RepID=UPI0035CB5C69